MAVATVLMNKNRNLAIELRRGPKWVMLIRFGSQPLHVSREPVPAIDKEFQISTLSLERTAMMFLGSYFQIADTAKEELVSIINEAQPEGTSMDVTNAKMQELVAHYNAHSGKPPIKKFSDIETARKRVSALAGNGKQKAPKKERAAKEKKTAGSISDGVKASWADKKVAAARAIKNKVTVAGTEYSSVHTAFVALKLPLGKVIRFRAVLKEKGSAEFDGHKFKLVPAVDKK